MRISLAVFFALFFLSTMPFSFADESKSFELSCVTEHPTTTFLITTDRTLPNDPELRVRMINHNGTKFIPIYSGVVTGFDLPGLEDRAVKISNIGKTLEMVFPMKNCRFDGDRLLSCKNGKPTRGENGTGVEIVPWNIRTVQKQETQVGFQREVLSIQLTLEIAGKAMAIAADYSPDDCR